MREQRTNRRPKERQQDLEEKKCFFCTHNVHDIDFKELSIIQKFVSSYAKILPRRRTGTCARHQRKLALAIKRARFLALLPFAPK